MVVDVHEDGVDAFLSEARHEVAQRADARSAPAGVPDGHGRHGCPSCLHEKATLSDGLLAAVLCSRMSYALPYFFVILSMMVGPEASNASRYVLRSPALRTSNMISYSSSTISFVLSGECHHHVNERALAVWVARGLVSLAFHVKKHAQFGAAVLDRSLYHSKCFIMKSGNYHLNVSKLKG